MPRRYGIIYCEDDPMWGLEGAELWRKLLKRGKAGEEEWVIYRLAEKGELPTRDDRLDGVIIPGSGHSVYENLPWIDALKAWLRSVYVPYISDRNAPEHAWKPQVVGSCFGAQAIAEALGGHVNRDPRGKYIVKAEEIFLTEAFCRMPFADGIVLRTKRGVRLQPRSDKWRGHDEAGSEVFLRVTQTHGDSVLTLPADSQVLGISATVTNEIFLCGRNMFAFQSHPEFTYKKQLMDKVIPYVYPERMSDADRLAADESFKKPLHSGALIEMSRRFIKHAYEETIGMFVSGQCIAARPVRSKKARAKDAAAGAGGTPKAGAGAATAGNGSAGGGATAPPRTPKLTLSGAKTPTAVLTPRKERLGKVRIVASRLPGVPALGAGVGQPQLAARAAVGAGEGGAETAPQQQAPQPEPAFQQQQAAGEEQQQAPLDDEQAFALGAAEAAEGMDTTIGEGGGDRPLSPPERVRLQELRQHDQHALEHDEDIAERRAAGEAVPSEVEAGPLDRDATAYRPEEANGGGGSAGAAGGGGGAGTADDASSVLEGAAHGAEEVIYGEPINEAPPHMLGTAWPTLTPEQALGAATADEQDLAASGSGEGSNGSGAPTTDGNAAAADNNHTSDALPSRMEEVPEGVSTGKRDNWREEPRARPSKACAGAVATMADRKDERAAAAAAAAAAGKGQGSGQSAQQ